ncbi:unnamed protein product [Dovyalis caffra]|uniref:Uncharacterized protein n=1 Tax=Dovyalis caffra TaxID=77055 RepID=A0AAV1RJI2_9ROSI|nr:unnamed protein product [Dovyalis caffra]
MLGLKSGDIKVQVEDDNVLDGVKQAKLILLVVEIGVMVAEVTMVVRLEPMVVEVLTMVIGATMRGVEEKGKVIRVVGKLGGNGSLV